MPNAVLPEAHGVTAGSLGVGLRLVELMRGTAIESRAVVVLGHYHDAVL